MADNTDNYALPYPEGHDGVVVHTDLERLAKKVDSRVKADIEATATQKSAEAVGDLHPRMGVAERATSPIIKGTNLVYEIKDINGATAFAVDEYGRTHIYDLVTGSGGGGGATPMSWHVFLAAGQSNMSGRGEPYGPVLDPVDPRILQYGANNRMLSHATVPLDMHDSPRGLSPATGFAREYLKHQPPGIGVILVPAARGGTSFNSDPDTYTWKPGAASAPEWDLYGQSVTQTQEALAAVAGDVKLKGVLWHQGEGNGGMSTAEYATELDDLIAAYREDFYDPALPFMVGQMSRESIQQYSTRRLIDRAHLATPARVEHTGFAPSEFGWVSYDSTHYGRTGALGLGERYLAAYWQALGNYVGAQVLPPQNVTPQRAGDEVTIRWEAPPTRVTSYQVETRPSGASWQTITRDWDMALAETITSTNAIDVRVTALNETEPSVSVTVTI